MRKYHRVKSITELSAVCEEAPREFLLVLNGGVASRKTVRFNRKTNQFRVENHIDDSTQILTLKQLDNEQFTLIGKAIRYGAFFWER